MTLTLTVDDQLHVYHDGGVVLTGYNRADGYNVSLDDACVLAIKAVDLGHAAGLLASTSTGVVTDASWKCSGGDAVEQTGWHLPGFDDTAWAQAQVVAANDGSFWMGVVASINSTAQWIWSQDISDDVIYCKKTLC